jgi:hypothetical protein
VAFEKWQVVTAMGHSLRLRSSTPQESCVKNSFLMLHLCHPAGMLMVTREEAEQEGAVIPAANRQ